MTDRNAAEGGTAARAQSAANLPVVEESDAVGEVAQLYARYSSHFGRPTVPGILKCFATHPTMLRSMMDLAENMLFVDGFLARRHKEMIATLVSTENRCAYCADSHGYSLRNLGGSAEQIAAIKGCYLDSPAFSLQEKSLLAFVDKITGESHSIHRGDIAKLIEAGWSESQIAEAIHITALFAAFNRIVSAFGVPSQHLLDPYENQDGDARIEPANSSKSIG